MECRKKIEDLYLSFLELAGEPLAASVLSASHGIAAGRIAQGLEALAGALDDLEGLGR